MNETTGHAPCCREQACDCEPGDWIPAAAAPDWPLEEEMHVYVPPGQVMVQPMHQLPAAAPMVSWSFRRTLRPEGAAWERES